MSDDYLAGPALLPDVTIMASWRDEATGRWKRRRVDLATLSAFILREIVTADDALDTRLGALERGLERFGTAFAAEQAEIDRIATQASGTDQTVAALRSQANALDARQTADAKVLADQAQRLTAAEGTITGQGKIIAVHTKSLAEQDAWIGRASTAMTEQAATVAAQGKTLDSDTSRISAAETKAGEDAARIKALEGKKDVVALFTAQAKLPAITLGSGTTVTLTSLSPTVAGDTIKKGEALSVATLTGLPPGVNISTVYAPADGTVAIQMTTGIAIALQSATTTFLIAALRKS